MANRNRGRGGRGGRQGDTGAGWMGGGFADSYGDRAYERYYGDRYYSDRDADPDWGPNRGGHADHAGHGGRGGTDTDRDYGPREYGGSGNRQSFAGRGPRGYRRRDERIEEDVNEALARHPELDATDIEVSVESGEVTLAGEVEDRRAKRLAEDIAEQCPGVNDIHNRLRARRGLLASTAGGGDSDRDQDRDRGEDRSRTERDVTPNATREGAAATSGGTTSGGTTSGSSASGTSNRGTTGRGRSASTS